MKYRYPFTPYPKGWYRVEPKANTVVAFGKKLHWNHCVNGDVFLIDSYHPKQMLPVVIKNGYHFIYYDEQAKTADFAIPDMTEFEDRDNWQNPFSLSWRIRAHIQEVVENALDLPHFCKVHTYKNMPTLARFEITDHQFNVIMHSKKNVFGFTTKTSMDITYYGMGIVIANGSTSSGILLKVLLTTTPVNEQYVDIRMEVAIKNYPCPAINHFLRALLPRHIEKEFARDIPVWENKIYRNHPLLCKVERNIVRIRKWANQFYK